MTVTLETQFSETGQSERWKNDVAKDLNKLISWAQWATEEADTQKGAQFASAVLRIVQRVAEFEEITVLKGEEGVCRYCDANLQIVNGAVIAVIADECPHCGCAEPVAKGEE